MSLMAKVAICGIGTMIAIGLLFYILKALVVFFILFFIIFILASIGD